MPPRKFEIKYFENSHFLNLKKKIWAHREIEIKILRKKSLLKSEMKISIFEI
jgi:hypothetical protein